jgi:hypothetical protein
MENKIICPICFERFDNQEEAHNHAIYEKHYGKYYLNEFEAKKGIVKQILTKKKNKRKNNNNNTININRSELRFIKSIDWDELHRNNEIPELIYNKILERKNKLELQKSSGSKR